ncbi:thioredoxin family protein [Aquisalimonas sp.]|uniref:thioredoxin family protein n=1 Tax=Aquisalimonas sp. TaxID=1872621 RepID=UPI0025BF1144|nr:thioredoxin family protein [Aquisalimonas sp.]
MTRRGFLGLAVLSIPAIWIGMEWRSRGARADIGVIGNGRPVIVQVHDPGCPTCRRLLNNVERAYPAFSDDIEFRIVDIETRQGASFAREHGVEHVTLVLFDGAGEVHQILEGVRSVDELESAFRSLQRQS